jgi:hypothetical protein
MIFEKTLMYSTSCASLLAGKLVKVGKRVGEWVKEQCLGQGTKGNRARRVSAVRRLLPPPSSVEPQTGVLGAIRFDKISSPSELIMREKLFYAFPQSIFFSHCLFASISLRIPWATR